MSWHVAALHWQAWRSVGHADPCSHTTSTAIVQGGINFGGEVFPRLRNWTPNNKATSVGNQLLTAYRKYLLAYETVHAPRDLGLTGPHQRPVRFAALMCLVKGCRMLASG